MSFLKIYTKNYFANINKNGAAETSEKTGRRNLGCMHPRSEHGGLLRLLTFLAMQQIYSGSGLFPIAHTTADWNVTRPDPHDPEKIVSSPRARGEDSIQKVSGMIVVVPNNIIYCQSICVCVGVCESLCKAHTQLL